MYQRQPKLQVAFAEDAAIGKRIAGSAKASNSAHHHESFPPEQEATETTLSGSFHVTTKQARTALRQTHQKGHVSLSLYALAVPAPTRSPTPPVFPIWRGGVTHPHLAGDACGAMGLDKAAQKTKGPDDRSGSLQMRSDHNAVIFNFVQRRDEPSCCRLTPRFATSDLTPTGEDSLQPRADLGAVTEVRQ